MIVKLIFALSKKEVPVVVIVIVYDYLIMSMKKILHGNKNVSREK